MSPNAAFEFVAFSCILGKVHAIFLSLRIAITLVIIAWARNQWGEHNLEIIVGIFKVYKVLIVFIFRFYNECKVLACNNCRGSYWRDKGNICNTESSEHKVIIRLVNSHILIADWNVEWPSINIIISESLSPILWRKDFNIYRCRTVVICKFIVKSEISIYRVKTKSLLAGVALTWVIVTFTVPSAMSHAS